MKARSLRFGIVAVPMLVTALVLQAHSRSEFFPPRASLSSLPLQIDGWTGTDDALDQQTLDILGPGEFLMRDYENASQPQPEPWINLYIAYFPTQRQAIRSIRRTIACRARDGFRFRETWFSLRVPTVLRSPSTATWFQKRESGNWCCTGFRRMAAWWPASSGPSIIWSSDSIRMNRSDGGLVRLMTPMLDGESPDAAQARLMKLGSQVVPLLDSYIPR